MLMLRTLPAGCVRTNIKLVHVPYQGSPPLVTDLVAGRLIRDLSTLSRDQLEALVSGLQAKVERAGTGLGLEPVPSGKSWDGSAKHARCSLRRSVRIGGERILVGPDAHQENVGAPLTTY
jgi:hypothetical protein